MWRRPRRRGSEVGAISPRPALLLGSLIPAPSSLCPLPPVPPPAAVPPRPAALAGSPLPAAPPPLRASAAGLPLAAPSSLYPPPSAPPPAAFDGHNPPRLAALAGRVSPPLPRTGCGPSSCRSESAPSGSAAALLGGSTAAARAPHHGSSAGRGPLGHTPPATWPRGTLRRRRQPWSCSPTRRGQAR
jgi:hypothetical protein